MDGVVKLVPVPRDEPPEDAAYQFNPASAGLPVAPKSTVPVPHRDAGVVPEMVGMLFMVAVTAVLAEVQPSVAST